MTAKVGGHFALINYLVSTTPDLWTGSSIHCTPRPLEGNIDPVEQYLIILGNLISCY